MSARCHSLLAGAAAALLGSATASGHHSYASYDPCKVESLAGQIQSITWANPHVLISLKTEAADVYRIEWQSLNALGGLNESPSRPIEGDRVEVTGVKNMNPEIKIMTLISGIHRSGDDWRWSRPRPLPARCSE